MTTAKTNRTVRTFIGNEPFYVKVSLPFTITITDKQTLPSGGP
jgi:hypothetical protein